MIKLENADWYQNCNFKIEYVDIEKSELQKKEKLNVYDQIKINTLLNILKSPMEYATYELSNKFGKSNSFIPFRKKGTTNNKYKEHLKNNIGHVDETIYNIFNNLFESSLYETFNTMHNDEKHIKINVHYKEITQTTECAVYPNNIVLNNIKVVGDMSSGIAINGKEVDLSQSTGYHYEEEYFFVYKGEII